MEKAQVSNNTGKVKTLLKDTAIFALGSIGSKVIMFFLVPFYSYYLSTEEWGVSDLVYSAAQVAIPIVSIVIFDSVIRFGIFYKNRPQDVLLVGLVVWIIGSAAVIPLSLLLNFYNTLKPWIIYVDLYVILSILLSILMCFIKAVSKNMVYAIVSIVQTLIYALSNILFIAVFKAGIEGYLISSLISQLVAVIITLFWAKIFSYLKTAKWDMAIAKEMCKYSFPLIANNLSWWAIQSSDKFMIEGMINQSDLGLYTAASRIPSIISVFVTVFQSAFGISSSREMDTTKDTTYFKKIFEVFSVAVTFAALALTIIIKPFMRVYVPGKGYEDAWRLVPFLLLSALFSAYSGYFGALYGAIKKTVNNMLSTFVAAITNVIANFVCIYFFGVYGAVMGTAISYIVLGIYRMVDVNRYMKIDYNIPKLVVNSVVFAIATIFSTLDFLKYLVPSVCMVVLIIYNFKELKEIITTIWNFLTGFFKKKKKAKVE